MEAVQDTHAICEAAICYTGDILDPKRDEVFAEVLRHAGEGARENGRAFPRDQGHGRASAGPTPRSALVKALKEEIGIPIHFHTHDTSGINAGLDPPRRAMPAWMSSISRSPR